MSCCEDRLTATSFREVLMYVYNLTTVLDMKKSAMKRKFPLLSLNIWMGSSDFLKLFIAVLRSSIHLL